MKQPEYQGRGWAIHNADCIEGMWAMPEKSVDCAIFSPPFGDLFVYSDSERDLGNAGDDQSFMDQYAFFADALARVMKPGRIACVHCTDLPTRKGKHGYIGLQDFSGDLVKAHTDAGMIYHGRVTIWKDPVVEMQRTKALGLLYKQIRKDSAMNRVGMPDYMLFFRAPGDNHDRIEHAAPGDIHAAMPIVKAWLAEMHRMGLASQTPTDEQIAALLPHAEFDVLEWQKLASPVWMNIQQGNVLNRMKGEDDEKHVCPLQLDVIEKCLRLYSKPGDVVMDPFNGVGSTGFQAVKMFRRYIGFELKPEYAHQANKNMKLAEASAGDLFGIAVERQHSPSPSME
jgi:hypothetical protein